MNEGIFPKMELFFPKKGEDNLTEKGMTGRIHGDGSHRDGSHRDGSHRDGSHGDGNQRSGAHRDSRKRTGCKGTTQ